MALTPKQQRFVEEYVIDRNASAAARRAGYSVRTAGSIGDENLKKPEIADAIAEKTAALSKAAQLSAEDVWREWGNLARSDIGDIIDFTGTDPKLKPACQIPESARRCISSVKVKRYTEGVGDHARQVEVIEFKLWDKPGTLATVAKALGKLVDRVEHTGADGGPVEVTVTDARKNILSFAEEFRAAATRNLAEAAEQQNGHVNGDSNSNGSDRPDDDGDGAAGGDNQAHGV